MSSWWLLKNVQRSDDPKEDLSVRDTIVGVFHNVKRLPKYFMYLPEDWVGPNMHRCFFFFTGISSE